MRGLIKNHYYKIISSLKIFLIFMFPIGISILLFGGRNENLLFSFLCLSVIAFPFISAISLRKNSSGKWNRYILSLPVKRCEIVKSVFVTQLITIILGSVLSMSLFLVSFALHGFAFYRYVDVLLLFSFSVGIILLMNAIFLPISYIDSNERTEAMGIISLVISVAIMIGLIVVINILVEKPSNTQLIIFSIINLILTFTAFILSYFLTSGIYSKQDC
jgi:hypothetical protein